MKKFLYEDQRVAAFFDVENLYWSAKKIFKGRVNFKKLLEDVLGKRKLIRAIAYVIETETGEEKPFFEALENMGIEIKKKPLLIYGKEKKANWDVGIAVDAIKIAPFVDTILLFSGDGDFVPLVNYLKEQGKRVEVIGFGKSTSSKLKESAHSFFDIEKSPKKYILKPKDKIKIKIHSS